ncbi:MAG: SDR family NAD(P)-dependent oxidoreductase, partial [Acidimicrobiia bacterium]|nr:SDR family NAD(P)-dependent oxidoreductase [Acidimicrobiia bacterium]NNL27420.1 SDR family NAD(P)-dependent oxidoreductase [Acidimicrobiia bacterium]
MRDLTDLTIAITGASAGIGAATARALADAGANVAMGARRVERLQDLATGMGDRALVAEMDVRVPEDARNFVEQTVSRFGRLDGIVANAGIGA